MQLHTQLLSHTRHISRAQFPQVKSIALITERPARQHCPASGLWELQVGSIQHCISPPEPCWGKTAFKLICSNVKSYSINSATQPWALGWTLIVNECYFIKCKSSENTETTDFLWRKTEFVNQQPFQHPGTRAYRRKIVLRCSPLEFPMKNDLEIIIC